MMAKPLVGIKALVWREGKTARKIIRTIEVAQRFTEVVGSWEKLAMLVWSLVWFA